MELEADTVVWAVGAVPDDYLLHTAMEGSVPVVLAGDVRRVGTLLDATQMGHKAALGLLYPDEGMREQPSRSGLHRLFQCLRPGGKPSYPVAEGFQFRLDYLPRRVVGQFALGVE